MTSSIALFINEEFFFWCTRLKQNKKNEQKKSYFPLEQGNVMANHTLRKGNQCADFLGKLDASSFDRSILR